MLVSRFLELTLLTKWITASERAQAQLEKLCLKLPLEIVCIFVSSHFCLWQILTLFPGLVFHPLSHGGFSFVTIVSFRNRFLSGSNFLKAVIRNFNFKSFSAHTQNKMHHLKEQRKLCQKMLLVILCILVCGHLCLLKDVPIHFLK